MTRATVIRLVLGFVTAVMLNQTVAAATDSAADEEALMTLAGGAWHAGKYVPCADGTVSSVHSRLVEPATGGHPRFSSGVVVEIALPTAPRFLNGQPFPRAAVVHYDAERGNKLMESEHPEDKLQVCLAGFPTPTHDEQTGQTICDPNEDQRGMVYRVYDYKRRAAYMGPDSQHSCGGA